ncbi:AsmA family protein [Sphingomonas sp. BIUV-7]|uniref:AsmA family protein n=1 Tax=Sphingomonas natans TaxID=3063330 RepID=A0ABT8Y791_9SPHN|nr:AsmA family protein [Sphingomonas sp. BIUV-7]MDO6413877.1 AsmA family protein [Sphingomonas sp. BIUV-7]
MTDIASHPSIGDDPRIVHPAPVRRDPVKTAIASVVSVLATLFGLLFLAWLVLFVTKGRFLKHTFEKVASKYMERDIRVAGDFNFYFDPIDMKFLAEGMTVSNPEWAKKPNLFSSKLIDTRIETLPLIFGKKQIEWLNLENGAIDLEWDKAHKKNSWTFAGDTPFQMPLIRRASVAGTGVHYDDAAMRIFADVRFAAIDAQNSKFASNIRFDGEGTARGIPFTLNGSQTSPNEVLAGGRNQFELHARAAKTSLDVSGTLPGATVIEGADLSVRVRGQNIRNLFDLAGIAVPDTRAYSLRSHLTKEGQDYKFTKIAGSYGNSDIGGAMTVTVPRSGTDERLFLAADLASKRVDMIDIGPFIGYNPNALATQGATAAATTQGPRGAYPRILPDAPLRVDAIKAFDAKVTYKVADIKQPFVPISNIVLGLDLDRSLLKLSPLNFDMAGGHVDSDIAIDARKPAVFTDYDIRMSPTPMGKLLAKFGVDNGGTTGTIKARVKMSGTGDTVRQSLATSNGRIAVILPRGTFWTSYTQLSEFDIGTFVQKMFEKKLKEPVQINCGLIGFTVRDGIAAADPVLIDTSKNVMTAKGGFSFRDESMSLAFRADAKKFSLFSGQSPVGIGGHFAAPAIQIVTPELLLRGGVGVALGVAAGPVGAMLAFVDPGDAKNAACGPVLAGATASAQRTDKGKARKDIGGGKSADVQAEKSKKPIKLKL